MFLSNRRGRKSQLSPEDRIAQAKLKLQQAEADAALAQAKDNPALQPLVNLLGVVRQRKNTGTVGLNESNPQSFSNRRYKYQLSFLVTLEEERLATAIQESADADLQRIDAALGKALQAIQAGEDPESISAIVSEGVQACAEESAIQEAERSVDSLKALQSEYRDLCKLPSKERTAQDAIRKATLENEIAESFEEAFEASNNN